MTLEAVIVGRKQEEFNGIQEIFDKKQISLSFLETGEQALLKLKKEKTDLFLTTETLPDMTARQLIENVIMINPMINSVVLSDMDAKDFHETYEGLGVLMQFPLNPGPEQIHSLQSHLAVIEKLAGQIQKGNLTP